MQPTEQDFEDLALTTARKEGWDFPDGLALSEGSLARACVKAGYALAAPAPLLGVEPAAPADEMNSLEAKVSRLRRDINEGTHFGLHGYFNMILSQHGAGDEGIEALMEDAGNTLEELLHATPSILAHLRALQSFKSYVHQRFDEANIDRHEEQNAINGCRVGARFDDLERYMQLTDAQKTREALVAVANGLAEAVDNEDMQQTYKVWLNVANALTTADSPTLSSLRLIQPPTAKDTLPAAPLTTIREGGGAGWVKCDGEADYQAEEEFTWIAFPDGKKQMAIWKEAYWEEDVNDNDAEPRFVWAEYDGDNYETVEPQPAWFFSIPAAPTLSQKGESHEA